MNIIIIIFLLIFIIIRFEIQIFRYLFSNDTMKITGLIIHN